MTQHLMPTIGAKREGPHAGGIAQKWVLTDQMKNTILARYDGRTETTDELVRLLRVPRWKIRRWAIELELTRPAKKEPPWTTADEEYLVESIHRSSIAAVAKKLGRTPTAVRVKAKRLHVAKSDSGYTLRRLCDCLGVDHHKVHRWIREGMLKGNRRHSERSELVGDMWHFSEREIRQFIRRYPAEIDPRRVEWVWVVGILAGIDSDI